MGCLVPTKKIMEIMSSRRTSSLRLGDTPTWKLIQHLKLRPENATTVYKHLYIYLYSPILVTFQCPVSPALSDVFLRSKNQRSAHPVLTTFQSQLGSEASPPSLISGLQECNHVQRHLQNTSWSLQLSFLVLENFGRRLSQHVTLALEL